MNRWSGWSSERLHSAYCAAARRRGGVWCWQSRCNTLLVGGARCKTSVQHREATHLQMCDARICCMYPPAYASIRQHTISTRLHTSAYVGIQRRYNTYFVLVCVCGGHVAIFLNYAPSHAKMKGIQARDSLTPMPPPSVLRFESLVNEDPPANVDGEHWVL